jgi:arginase
MSARTIEVLGVPSSAGAHWPGQEKGPAALRAAGLVEELRGHGRDVVDYGDPAPTRFQLVKEGGVSNPSTVVAVARQTADRVRATRRAGRVPLVLGGDCSITVGVVAALDDPDPGLLYVDGGLDLETPAGSPRGILDSMGPAHLLGFSGTYAPLTEIGRHRPMLRPEGLVGFGVNVGEADVAELDARGIVRFTADDVRHDARAARAAVEEWLARRDRPFVLHFDVDVVDFYDLPVADYPQHADDDEGLPFATAMESLAAFVASPLLAAVVVTELNPDHATPADVRRFALGLAEALAEAA